MDSVNDDSAQPKQGDALLIELVSQFPCLYNKQLKEYRNNSLREAAWIAISECMNMIPSECTKRWSQLRDNFGREKRRRDEESRSGSGLSQRRGFSFFEEMRFLERYVQKRRTLSNVQTPAHTPYHGFEQNNQLMSEGCSIMHHNVITTPRYRVIAENSDMVQRTPLPHVSEAMPSLPMAITTSSQYTSTPLLVLPKIQSFNEPTTITVPISSATISTGSQPHTTEVAELVTRTPIAPSPAILPGTPSSPSRLMSSSPVTSTQPVITATTIFSSPGTSTKDMSVSMQVLPQPLASRSSSPISTASTSASLHTHLHSSPISPLMLPLPSITQTTSPHVDDTTFSSTREFSKTSAPSSRIIYPKPHSLPSCATTTSLSAHGLHSSMQALPSPTAMAQTSDDSYSASSPEIPSTSVRKATTSKHYLNIRSNREATACYNKKLEKVKEVDPMESSFLNLSNAIQEHLTKRMHTDEKSKDTTVVPRSGDEAFANLIAVELANLDDRKKAVKKAKLLKVLYEEEA